LNKNNPPNKAG